MEKIKVNIIENKKEYDVTIGDMLLPNVADVLKKSERNVVIIVDFCIKNFFGDKINTVFQDFDPLIISVLGVEESKSRQTKQEVEELMLEKGLGRDTIIVAIGGGVIGDLAGFVAATFNRGIPFIQVPTSLLAMVDASVGGKAGINTSQGKNLIGCFHQPDGVFIDLNFLETLPKEELLNGLAEIVKMSLILDKDLFEFIEKNSDKILTKDKEIMVHLIKRCVELKRDVVQKDEKESGLRQILNFGHTIGHAIETESDFEKKHGLCVSLGMVAESKISRLKGLLSEKDEKRIVVLLQKLGLPTKIDDVNVDSVIQLMKQDKKSIDTVPRFVLLNKIGEVMSKNNMFSFEVEEGLIKKALK